jgi:hypothetical protein
MQIRTLAAAAAAMAVLVAHNASATVMVFQGQGVVSSFSGLAYGLPAIQIGDLATVTFTYDTNACSMAGAVCYGGNSDPLGPGRDPVREATFSVDGWTKSIVGRTYDEIRPGYYNLQDDVFLLVRLPAPADATIATDFSGTGGSANLISDFDNPYRLSVTFGDFLIKDPPDTLAAVPEPGAWMLMITGVGAIGLAMRRRRAYGEVV